MTQNRRAWIEALRLLLDMGAEDDFRTDPEEDNGEQLSRIVWLEEFSPSPSTPEAMSTQGNEVYPSRPRIHTTRSVKKDPNRTKKRSPKKVEPRIEWGNPDAGGLIDLQGLVGVEDAYEHTPLLAGERVAVCTRDQVAYHLNTWQFLKTYNRSCCCACGRGDKIILVTLPGVFVQPAIEPVYAPAPWVSGEEVISLTEVESYIGRAVVVEDYVYNVHRSQKGTFFIKFQPKSQAPRPFDGFKVVIFNALAQNWERACIDPHDYEQHIVRVRGVIRQHDDWGIEILVSSPRLIQIVDESKKEA